MKTLRSLLKAYSWTNGGKDETLTDAKNRELYLKTERSRRIIIPTEIPLAVLSVERNPGAFQTVQPDAPMPLPAAFRYTQPHRRARHGPYTWPSPFACTDACIEYLRRMQTIPRRGHPSYACIR